MRLLRLGLGLGLALALSACGSGGILGLNPRAAGDITVSDATTGAALVTSFAKPYLVTNGGFSIAISESNFSGPYSVDVISWTAPFSLPCFVPHSATSNTGVKANVWVFSADNAAPVTTPDQVSPCNYYATSTGLQLTEETVHIADNDGHSVLFYYKSSSR